MPSPKTKPVHVLPAKKDEASSPPQTQMLDVCNLRPHPRQAELVGDMPPAEFDALAKDIDVNGIRNPLVLMADKRTIIGGHQRLRSGART